MRPFAQAVVSALGADKRLLPALGTIIVLVSLLIWRAGYNYHADALGEIASRADEYSALRSTIDRAGDIRARREFYEQKLRALESGLLGDDKPSIGAARLQEAFKALASKHGITVLSQKALPAAPADHYVRVPVEFQVKTELPRLKDLLCDMQASPILMGVRYLRVKAPGPPSQGGIDVTIVVEGAIIKRSGV